jgi:hypothetical protein
MTSANYEMAIRGMADTCLLMQMNYDQASLQARYQGEAVGDGVVEGRRKNDNEPSGPRKMSPLWPIFQGPTVRQTTAR